MKALHVRRGSALGWVMAAGLLLLAGCKVETFWSPDGKTIAYLADGELRLYDAASKTSKRLDTGAGRVMSAAWSPDGQRIAFYHAVLGKEAGVSLRVIEPASGKVTTLVVDIWPVPKEPPPVEKGASAEQALREAQEQELGNFDYLARLAWSPDGKRIAYVGASDEEAGVFLLTYPAEGIKAVGRDSQIGMQVMPAWSPDGKRLAYALIGSTPAEPPAGGGAQAPVPDSLWLYDPAAGKSVKVCDAPGEALAAGTRLQWARDSRQIGFIAVAGEGEAATGCLVEAQAAAQPRKAIAGITALAAWSPGLEGVAYVGEPGETGRAPVRYRPRESESAKTLGQLEVPRAAQEPSPGPATEEAGLPYSLPEFSPDGSRVALRVGEKAQTRVAVFAVK